MKIFSQYFYFQKGLFEPFTTEVMNINTVVYRSYRLVLGSYYVLVMAYDTASDDDFTSSS